MRNSVFGQFSSLPPRPTSLKNADFIFIVVSKSLSLGQHKAVKKTTPKLLGCLVLIAELLSSQATSKASALMSSKALVDVPLNGPTYPGTFASEFRSGNGPAAVSS